MNFFLPVCMDRKISTAQLSKPAPMSALINLMFVNGKILDICILQLYMDETAPLSNPKVTLNLTHPQHLSIILPFITSSAHTPSRKRMEHKSCI